VDPNFGEMPGNNDIMVARVEGGSAPAAALAERPPEPPRVLPSEPEERSQIAALGAATSCRLMARSTRSTAATCTAIRKSRSTVRRRHVVGCLPLCHGRGRLDFVVVTDHQSGDQPYPWWRIQKSADMFRCSRLLHRHLWHRAERGIIPTDIAI